MPLAALSLYGLPAYQIQKLQNPKLSEFWILRSLYSKKEIFFILDHCYEPLHHISIPLRLLHHHFHISISFLLQHHTFLLFSIQHHLHHISLSPLPPPPPNTHTHTLYTHTISTFLLFPIHHLRHNCFHRTTTPKGYSVLDFPRTITLRETHKTLTTRTYPHPLGNCLLCPPSAQNFVALRGGYEYFLKLHISKKAELKTKEGCHTLLLLFEITGKEKEKKKRRQHK